MLKTIAQTIFYHFLIDLVVWHKAKIRTVTIGSAGGDTFSSHTKRAGPCQQCVRQCSQTVTILFAGDP